ncbi:hypothetical protein BEWA_054020 [Theileria equi strain WA]|uniref:Uncharacterized protein n=1 Tax=Theileria equi strain WA TaxID=1537102 RepID=L1LDC6_THEEQ|nr:hypothetical protein BEWA_054020 [Theileria equi strain WA]EKX73346.1 hypothetical protein BEWA_054020 [Theileria equi strain WA]|eukprot:XP_004832798.1 hypothetical protein BEWA_054020 [Theileria equi strain WA]
MTKKVTIDIDKTLKSGTLNDGGKRYYNDEEHNERVDVILTESLQNLPEYVTLTHKPTNGDTIGNIKYSNYKARSSGSGTHTTLIVYYWSGDTEYKNPLVVKLSGEKEKYYTTDTSTSGKERNPRICSLFTNFSQCGSDTKINDIALKDTLDKQNCKRNEAHILNLSQNGSTTYPCPSGCQKQISVSTHGYSDFTYSTHYIPGYGNLSVSGFKEGSIWQVGLPSIRSISSITVYFISNTNTPIVINYNKGGEKYFRRNKSTGNTWTAVSQDKALKLLNDQEYYPKVTIKLSMPANAPYPDEGTKINITVRSSFIEGGYYISRHSLCGGLFKVTQVKHGQGTTLEGISSNYPIESVTAYYNGDDYITKDPILVELAVKNTSKTGYIYYGKSTAQDNSWRAFLNSGTRHNEAYLRKKLKSMRETKLLPSKTTDIIETTLIVTDVLAGGGTMGYGGWKLFGVLATRL